jgi:hypothetical protein
MSSFNIDYYAIWMSALSYYAFQVRWVISITHKIRPPLKSKTNKRPTMLLLLPDVTGCDLGETSDSIILSRLVFYYYNSDK